MWFDCDWQRDVVASLASLAGARHVLSDQAAALHSATQGLASRSQDRLAALSGCRNAAVSSRDILRQLATKRRLVEVTYARAYFANQLRLTDFVAGLGAKLAGQVSIAGAPELFLSGGASPCELLRPDQIGLKLPVSLRIFGSGYTATLTCRIGVSCEGSTLALYLAGCPSLTEFAPALPADSIASQLEAQLAQPLGAQIAAHTFDTFDTSGLGTALTPIANETDDATFRVMFGASGTLDPLHSPSPFPPLGTMPPNTDEVIRVSAELGYLMLERMVATSTAALAAALNANLLHFDEISRLGPSAGPRIALQGNMWCTGDFGKQDYGMHRIVGSFVLLADKIPTNTNVLLAVEVIGPLGEVLNTLIGAGGGGAPSIMTIKDAKVEHVRVGLDNGALAVAIKYGS